ncbi:MAG: valine--tRNA ligase [Candidatus Eisenbacteria bacterium]|nr:valine--tRNA ligase [Candidatus Eisenbacteria bacterium]
MPDPGLEKTYDPSRVESRWYADWIERGLFTPQPDPDRKPFTVVIPPPNVTGRLTMGHVLNNSLQDAVVRWKRMEGSNTLWLPGTDHAGIATQNVVERHLKDQGVSKESLGREAFVARVWEWKHEYGGIIQQQLRLLGCSLDWSRERFTMDEGLSHAVREVFVRLYRKGLIYRGSYVVNWCPRCLTALSDEEVDRENRPGHLWHLKYPVAGTRDKFITVATTRPETMLGDVAVAVHPRDSRYKALRGKTAILPILRREIPILADDYVDPKFGTGAVKITPAHDANDFWVAQRHGLEAINVMHADGTMNENAADYAGMDRFEARERIVAALQDRGLVAKIEPYDLSPGECSRCHTPIEPRLSPQWYVKMKPLADAALAVHRKGKVKFYPKRWNKVYVHWLENTRDWCISRQLWWGHRIPVWTCGCGEIIVDSVTPAACPKCGSAGLKQDEDVLDTWFSSWLWPFSTLGWPEPTEDLRYFYPTAFLSTGADIIFFWVARMIMAGLEFMGEVPFSHVFFHSIVRDTQGRKMSKSLGNSPEPMDLMSKYGADAVRFTMISLTPPGQDLVFDEARCETGRHFANKVWNATRLVLMNSGDFDPAKVRESQLKFSLADRWILDRRNEAIKDVNRCMKTFRFNDAANAVYHFLWGEYCDWYLELAKTAFQEGGEAAQAARWTAVRVLDDTLRLLHPFMPFVSEELWQSLPGRKADERLPVAAWPKQKAAWRRPEVVQELQQLQEVITAVRTLRSEMNVSPGQPVKVLVQAPAGEVERLRESAALIRSLCRAETLEIGAALAKPAACASAVAAGCEIYLPLAGLIDLAAERDRLARELERVEGLLLNARKKLSNQDFLTKARPEVVERERGKVEELAGVRDKVERALKAIG